MQYTVRDLAPDMRIPRFFVVTREIQTFSAYLLCIKYVMDIVRHLTLERWYGDMARLRGKLYVDLVFASCRGLQKEDSVEFCDLKEVESVRCCSSALW